MCEINYEKFMVVDSVFVCFPCCENNGCCPGLLLIRRWRLRKNAQKEAFLTYLIGMENLGRGCSQAAMSYLVHNTFWLMLFQGSLLVLSL